MLNGPDGVKVYGNMSTLIDTPNFRCLFGGEIETVATKWEEDGVWCETPPNNGSWLNSDRPNIIQILNDRRDYYDVSNALTFVLLLDPVPVISFISPTSADRFCYSSKTCSPIYVYGHHFTGGAQINCVFFGTYTTLGTFAGQRRINKVLYDRISCPTPTYPVTPMKTAVSQPDGFQVTINRSNSGPSASNKVEWTFTCAPCDL